MIPLRQWNSVIYETVLELPECSAAVGELQRKLYARLPEQPEPSSKAKKSLTDKWRERLLDLISEALRQGRVNDPLYADFQKALLHCFLLERSADVLVDYIQNMRHCPLSKKEVPSLEKAIPVLLQEVMSKDAAGYLSDWWTLNVPDALIIIECYLMGTDIAVAPVDNASISDGGHNGLFSTGEEKPTPPTESRNVTASVAEAEAPVNSNAEEKPTPPTGPPPAAINAEVKNNGLETSTDLLQPIHPQNGGANTSSLLSPLPFQQMDTETRVKEEVSDADHPAVSTAKKAIDEPRPVLARNEAFVPPNFTAAHQFLRPIRPPSRLPKVRQDHSPAAPETPKKKDSYIQKPRHLPPLPVPPLPPLTKPLNAPVLHGSSSNGFSTPLPSAMLSQGNQSISGDASSPGIIFVAPTRVKSTLEQAFGGIPAQSGSGSNFHENALPLESPATLPSFSANDHPLAFSPYPTLPQNGPATPATTKVTAGTQTDGSSDENVSVKDEPLDYEEKPPVIPPPTETFLKIPRARPDLQNTQISGSGIDENGERRETETAGGIDPFQIDVKPEPVDAEPNPQKLGKRTRADSDDEIAIVHPYKTRRSAFPVRTPAGTDVKRSRTEKPSKSLPKKSTSVKRSRSDCKPRPRQDPTPSKSKSVLKNRKSSPAKEPVEADTSGVGSIRIAYFVDPALGSIAVPDSEGCASLKRSEGHYPSFNCNAVLYIVKDQKILEDKILPDLHVSLMIMDGTGQPKQRTIPHTKKPNAILKEIYRQLTHKITPA